MNSRLAWAATAAIVLCAAALLALTPRGNAAPSVANGVLSLSGATTSQTLYDNLPAEQFAVSVKVNSGSATIEGTADGVLWASLGTLVAGSGCVFEGSYQAVRAVGASASGSYEVRSPTDVANEDDRVGTLNGLMLSGSMRVYHSGTDHNRHMRVKAITGTVQVLDEAGATVIAEIDPGDAAMIHDECDRLWLAGSGAVADVILFDANPDPDGQQPAGNANDEGEAHAGKDDDEDPIYRGPTDGKQIQCVAIAFTPNPYPATSKGPVKIKYQYRGEPPAEYTVDPGDTIPPLECNLVSVDCFFEKKGDSLHWKRTKQGQVHN